MKVDVVLCVKSIRVHAHTPAHTHISYSQIEFSPFQEMNLRRSAEIYLVFVVHFPHNLPFLTQ